MPRWVGEIGVRDYGVKLREGHDVEALEEPKFALSASRMPIDVAPRAARSRWTVSAHIVMALVLDVPSLSAQEAQVEVHRGMGRSSEGALLERV